MVIHDLWCRLQFLGIEHISVNYLVLYEEQFVTTLNYT